MPHFNVGNTYRRTHGESNPHTKEYQAWAGMINRCENKNDPSYRRYGGRGIKVCKKWRKSYIQFLFDMGRSPSPTYSLDRIDNNGNYIPSNCRWASKSQQAYNRQYKLSLRDVEMIHKLFQQGISHHELAKKYNIHQCHVSRVLSGKRRPLSHIKISI